MSRQITIELIKNVTVVTFAKDGKTSVQSTSKSRELTSIPGGVQILPDKDETTFSNEKILLSELTDDFGATTGDELVKKFAELGFFKNGGGGVSEMGTCFHLKDNTLKMCNVNTVFNSSVLGLSDGFTPNRVIAFVELPDFPISNIRCKLNVGFTKLYKTKKRTTLPPFTAEINTTIINIGEWLAYTQGSGEFTFDKVTHSEVSSDVENSPGNFAEKLNEGDLLDTPETLINNLDNLYLNSEPIEVKTGFFPDGKKGILVYFPKDVSIGIVNSAFVNLAELEITFDNIDDYNEGLYRSFPDIILYEESTIEEFENREIKYFNSSVVVGPPIGNLN
jgi:hypothetical protein